MGKLIIPFFCGKPVKQRGQVYSKLLWAYP
jgi:hypothetical protein